MPLVDMSVEKLKTYAGRNPRPADFDAFWDKALAEMNAIDPKATFTPVPFACKTMECFDLYFTSTKGARIYARFARPKHFEGKIPAVLQFHGLSGNNGCWSDMTRFVSQGYAVAYLDSRGQGGLSEDVGGAAGTTYTTPFVRGLDGPPEGLLVRDLFLDTAMLARIVMGLDYVDEKRVGVVGGSQGGALSIACAALVPEIKLCAANFPYYADYKRVWEMDLAKGAYEGLRYYFRWFDPAHEHEDEVFEKLGYIDIQFLAPRVRAKVLMACCLMDTTCPPSTQFAVYNKMTCEKSVVFYPDYAHEEPRPHKDRIFTFLAEL